MRSILVLFSLLLWSAPAGAGEGASVENRSVLGLESVWTNHDGKRVPFPEFKGSVRLFTMVYTGCEYACPLTVEALQRILRAVPSGARKRVKIDLFSFDSEKDTPAALKGYLQKKKLDPKQWTLYHGDADAVRELAAALGVTYKRISDVDFSHTTVLSVIDSNGVIRTQKNGFKGPVDEIAGELTKLLK